MGYTPEKIRSTLSYLSFTSQARAKKQNGYSERYKIKIRTDKGKREREREREKEIKKEVE